MKIYQIWFIKTHEEGYNANAKQYVRNNNNENDKIYLNDDRTLIALEHELMKYWSYGGGFQKLIRIGELNDSYFKPTISEAEFIDNEIRSKKNNLLLGYQG